MCIRDRPVDLLRAQALRVEEGVEASEIARLDDDLPLRVDDVEEGRCRLQRGQVLRQWHANDAVGVDFRAVVDQFRGQGVQIAVDLGQDLICLLYTSRCV